MSEKQSPQSIQRWFNAHVESRLLQATINLRLLEPLLRHPLTPQALAEVHGYDLQGVHVLMRGLAGLGIVSRNSRGQYQLVDRHQTAFDSKHQAFIGPMVAEAQQFWYVAGELKGEQSESFIRLAIGRMDQVRAQTNELIEHIWGYAWTAALMALAEWGVLEAAERPYPLVDLVSQSGTPSSSLTLLLKVGKRWGILNTPGDKITLTEAAHLAFGKGSIQNYTRWISQRLCMDRQYFWHSLGQLEAGVSDGKPISKHSTPGENDAFRQTFIRINQLLLPLLQQVSDKIAIALKAHKRPLHLLEIGAGLGHWGIAWSNAHPESQVTAVDTAGALAETQRIITNAGLSERYRWQPGNIMTYNYQSDQYDLVVLNEVVHTIPPTHVSGWLKRVTGGIKPGGLLLIADMVLNDNYTGPLRHLLAGVKLFVSGGGQLMSADDYHSRLQQIGLSHIHISRLPTTDLIVARKPLTLN